MKTTLALCLVVLLAVAYSNAEEENPAEAPKQVCEPNSEFMKECNRCRCNANGTQSACTRRGCPPKGDASNRAARDTSSHGRCTPGESYKHTDGCNSCTCPADGNKARASCTLIACLNPSKN